MLPGLEPKEQFFASDEGQNLHLVRFQND